MKLKINYISTNWYDKSNIKQWMWYFRKWKGARGFTVRIFGVHMIIRENRAKEKLIKKINERFKNLNSSTRTCS
jgi:hypothetical protein